MGGLPGTMLTISDIFMPGKGRKGGEGKGEGGEGRGREGRGGEKRVGGF